jgi:phage FluMu protein Com
MAKTKHNHETLPFGGYVAPGQCPRCDELRAEKEALGETQHNHERLPFGRRLPLGQCPRCDELHHGAAPRENNATRAARMDAEHAASIRAHFGPGHNERCSHMHRDAQGHWHGVCTFGDW